MVLIILAAIIFYGRLYLKGVSFTVDERLFKQAGVIIDFYDHTITLKGKTLPVGKVTGISMEAFTSTRKHGDSMAKRVTINLDDFSKPQCHILFISKGHARNFMQRVATALRKAGGRDFV